MQTLASYLGETITRWLTQRTLRHMWRSFYHKLVQFDTEFFDRQGPKCLASIEVAVSLCNPPPSHAPRPFWNNGISRFDRGGWRGLRRVCVSVGGSVHRTSTLEDGVSGGGGVDRGRGGAGT